MSGAALAQWDRSDEQVLREYRLAEGISPDLCRPFRGGSVVWWPRLGAGAMRPAPPAAELDHFYRYEYRRIMTKMRGLGNYLQSPNYVAQARSQVAWIPASAPRRGHWLDIGAGFGLLLHEARQRFLEWDFSAVEADSEAVSELGVAGHAVLPPREFWDHEVPADRLFDVVTLSHVLEHLLDPWAALGRIANWLRPGGWLLVEVPNDTPSALLHPRRRSDLPHVWFFAKDGLQRVAQATGYEVMRVSEVGLRPYAEGTPWVTRLRLAVRRRIWGAMSVVGDPVWYAEGPGRANLRLLAQKAG